MLRNKGPFINYDLGWVGKLERGHFFRVLILNFGEHVSSLAIFSAPSAAIISYHYLLNLGAAVI